MTEFSSERLLTEVPRRNRMVRLRPAGMILVPLVAILFQVYLPRFFQYLGYLELPLLVTVYFALMRRQPIPGLLFGAVIGLGAGFVVLSPLACSASSRRWSDTLPRASACGSMSTTR